VPSQQTAEIARCAGDENRGRHASVLDFAHFICIRGTKSKR
jgi:hypothetical protein